MTSLTVDHDSMKEASPKHVLITGVAGFIGFHVARVLSQDKRHLVIGVDNFNDYYDVQLKIDRAYELHSLGVSIFKHDLCDAVFLRQLMTSHNFTHVIHLAAQAGVRQSLLTPLTYITANIECQLVLLDALKSFSGIKLVYASSSSVYGKGEGTGSTNGRLFRLTDKVDQPSNLYAATKRSGELFSSLYCSKSSRNDLRVVGLRFFTVYGPWGRPDMAVYKFARSVFTNTDLQLYSLSSDRYMSRDFTYIDDVVTGIISALDYTGSTGSMCNQQLNVGNGRPVSIEKLIRIIEKELNSTAKIKLLPLPSTEILDTWADISETHRLLNYTPNVQLEEGVKLFIGWFKVYHSSFNSSYSLKRHCANKWFHSL